MRGKTTTLKLGMRNPATEAAMFCSHFWSSPRPKWMVKKIRMRMASANQDAAIAKVQEVDTEEWNKPPLDLVPSVLAVGGPLLLL